MKHLAYATFVLYWSVVLVPIESNKTYIYNYTNFQEFFPQDKLDDFKLYKYEDIEDHFKEKYVLQGFWITLRTVVTVIFYLPSIEYRIKRGKSMSEAI